MLSASGMCEGGRILHHLRNNIEDPRNTVLITGFQAENTLGRKILNGDREVPIFGEPMRLRAEVVSLDELSGHADQGELIEWMRPHGGASEESIPGARRALPGRRAGGSDPQGIQSRRAATVARAQLLAQLTSISMRENPIMAFCVNCGSQLPDTGRFCTNCGSAISGAVSATASPPPMHQPLDYTIQGDNLQVIRIRLQPGQELFAEAGQDGLQTAAGVLGDAHDAAKRSAKSSGAR